MKQDTKNAYQEATLAKFNGVTDIDEIDCTVLVKSLLRKRGRSVDKKTVDIETDITHLREKRPFVDKRTVGVQTDIAPSKKKRSFIGRKTVGIQTDNTPGLASTSVDPLEHAQQILNLRVLPQSHS
jgi:hypothetical protein